MLNASVAATRASAADVGDGASAASFDHGTGRLHRDIKIGHPVLERLEAADRPTELLSLLGVFDGEFQAARGRADLLGGQQDRRGIGHTGICA